MPYCQSCGREVTQGFEFCPNCGSALNRPPNLPIAPIATYPPPTKTGINKKIVAIIIVAVIAIATIGLILLLTGDEDEKDEENNGRPNVELSISTDKTTYNFQENAIVSLTVDNKMNRDFPYGDYGFDIFIVNKEEYDSMSYSYILDSENYEARQTIETLTVSGGDLESVTITWVLDTDNYQGPGQYYFVFKIEKDIGDNRSIVIEREEALITITD
jgi:hypothetical protein